VQLNGHDKAQNAALLIDNKNERSGVISEPSLPKKSIMFVSEQS